MNIPNEVMSVFEKEVESINYGKVSLGVIRRGSHEHYEIDKHITIPKTDADENSKVVFNENNDDSKL